jgi:uncharacterized SAM-binding protein YcdF (DUF218 family)
VLFFNKFLPVFVLPFGWVVFLLLFALIRRKRWPVIAALIILYGASTPFVADRLIGWLEADYPPVALAQVETADAVVVLGSVLGPQVEEGFVPNWSDAVERFEAGVILQLAGKAGRLVFTGAPLAAPNRERTEGAVLRRLAIARGVAAEKIMVTPDIENTATEAAAVAALAKAEHWQRVILVTSAWHMPRSEYLFKKAGLTPVVFPVDFRRDRQRHVVLLDFVPKGEAWQMTETALRECYGNLFYRVFR